MIPVNVMPRFKCDFCKKRSTKAVMALHEKRCFRNPDRFCDECENTGFVDVAYDGGVGQLACPYCSKFDPKQLREIETREAAKSGGTQ